jgi:hypothetical protein
MDRAYYFARRIPKNAEENQILPINPEMSVGEIHNRYVEKRVVCDNYISHGPWILRPIVDDGVFHPNNFPSEITPYDIWGMVRCKIEMSDVLVALVDTSSFGTIVEVGFAAGLGTVAVYVLPDKKNTQEEIKDLWLVFQNSLQTRHLWRDEDITNVTLFSEYGITNAKEYGEFVSNVVPNFLTRR